METNVDCSFDVVKVFTATFVSDRHTLGDKITEWLRFRKDLKVVDTVVVQSSDSRFHCLSIVFFLKKRF